MTNAPTSAEILAAYRAAKDAERAWKDVQARAIAAGTADFDTADGKGTVVRGKTRRPDVVKAREALSAPMFRKVTKTVIDLAALDREVESGKIRPDVLATFLAATDNAPFVKVTLR